ncbi:DUF5986 family protein [Priestia aryabhattai]
MNNFQIPIDDFMKSQIYKALVNGSKDMDSFIADQNLSFNNGFPLVRWAFINQRLYFDVQNENVRNLKCKRGPWPLVLMFDDTTGYLYVFMKKNRFEEVQIGSRQASTPFHYIEALSSYNIGVESELDEYNINKDNLGEYQTYLEIDSESEVALSEEILNSMLGDLKEQVKRLVMITFTTSSLGITDFKAIIPTTNLDIIYQEDWSAFIDVEYNTNEEYGEFTEDSGDDIDLLFIDEDENGFIDDNEDVSVINSEDLMDESEKDKSQNNDGDAKES